MLDCDHVPEPHFLEAMLGGFRDQPQTREEPGRPLLNTLCAALRTKAILPMP